ncbi:MAG: hypothetical protein K6U87_05835 [Firmicutes bacterium]|nr:hypothetical protein [Bacillota bacterium]
MEQIELEALPALWRARIRRLLAEQLPALITEDGRVLGILTPAAFGALRGRAVLHDDLVDPVGEPWHADPSDSR